MSAPALINAGAGEAPSGWLRSPAFDLALILGVEAMALGVPVVSTAVMGTIDVLQPGSGAIVVNENADEFADAAIRVLTNPEQRAALGAAGQDYVRAWSSSELASRLVNVYGHLLAQSNASRVASVPA